MSLRTWTVALPAYQIEDTKCKSPGCFKMLLLIDSQTAILSVCQQFVCVQCVHTLHTSYRLYPTFGVMWLALTRFFPACLYITFTWADSFAPCCFHPYLSQTFSPTSQTWKGYPSHINFCTGLIGWPYRSVWPFAGFSHKLAGRVLLQPLPQENLILYLTG